MKLSQIRNLSWSLALCGVGVCGYYSWQTIKADVPSQKIRLWKPSSPEATDIDQAEKMSQQKLMNALAFLTKVDPPYVAPIQIKNNNPVVEIPDAPKPVSLNLAIELSMIAYDDGPRARHLAFIKSGKKAAHPYFLKEKIIEINEEVRVFEITRNYVIVKSKDGRTQKLEMKNMAIKNIIKMPLRTALLKLDPPKTKKPVVSKTVKKSKKNIFRMVPKSRSSTYNKDYSINIVEYNAGGDDKRYAISTQDQQKLENQKFRLMSEVNVNPAYDKSGKPNGILIDFMVDNPLLKGVGFQHGDIVTHINDMPVRTVEDAQRLYDGLTSSDRRVKIQMIRNEHTLIIYLEMDDFPNVPDKR